jgi:hypothetical protein
MYTNLNMIFYKFILAGAKSRPPKPQWDSPACSGWSSSHVRHLPNPEQGGNEPMFFRGLMPKFTENEPIFGRYDAKNRKLVFFDHRISNFLGVFGMRYPYTLARVLNKVAGGFVFSHVTCFLHSNISSPSPNF